MQRKLSFLIFLLLLFAFATSAWAVEAKSINGFPVASHKTYDGIWSISKIKAHNGFAIASGTPPLTCTVLSANSSFTGFTAFHRYNVQQLQGIVWDNGSSGSICKFRFNFYDNTGDISIKDYYAEVWLLGASRELSTLIGRSEKVDGNDSWSNELVDFTWATPAAYDCTGSNQYGILIKAVANDAAADSNGTFSDTNYPRTLYSNGTNTMTGCVGTLTWNSATGAAGTLDTTDMPVAEVWTMQ